MASAVNASPSITEEESTAAFHQAQIDQVYNPSHDLIVYHHVPKSGGTSLHAFLSSVLGGNKYAVTSWEDLETLDIKEMSGLGGHHYNYDRRIYADKLRNYVKIIIVRDPLERVYSLYNHVMRYPKSHHIALAHPSKDVSNMTFHEFALFCVEYSIPDAANLTARFICGSEDDPTRVDRVLSILDSQFRFAYPLDLCSLLYHDLGAFLGAPQAEIDKYSSRIKLNASKANYRPTQQIAEAAPIILAANNIDYMIYRHVCEKYNDFACRAQAVVKEVAKTIKAVHDIHAIG